MFLLSSFISFCPSLNPCLPTFLSILYIFSSSPFLLLSFSIPAFPLLFLPSLIPSSPKMFLHFCLSFAPCILYNLFSGSAYFFPSFCSPACLFKCMCLYALERALFLTLRKSISPIYGAAIISIREILLASLRVRKLCLPLSPHPMSRIKQMPCKTWLNWVCSCSTL